MFYIKTNRYIENKNIKFNNKNKKDIIDKKISIISINFNLI